MSKSLILLVVAVVVVGSAALYFQSNRENAGHRMASTNTSVLKNGDPIVSVTVPDALEGSALIGKTAFDAKCAVCHGANAVGQNGVAPPLVHKIYEPSHHGDESFQIAVANGVRAHHWKFGNMMPVDGLTRGDVEKIVAYVRTLQRANGIN